MSKILSAAQGSENATASREAVARGYGEVGLPMDKAESFELGGTIATAKETLLYEKDGVGYSWGGALPKSVPAGSTPATTGGIGSAAWVDQSAKLLRPQLGAVILWPENAPVSGTIVVPSGKRVKSFIDHTSATTGVTVAAGGSFEGGSVQNTATASGFDVTGNGASVSDVTVTGMATPNSDVSNGVSANGFSDLVVSDIDASGHTTAVAMTETHRVRITGILAKALWYQPSLVAGGYAVLLQDASESVITDVIFTANEGDDGRHMLYVSTIGGDKCSNTVFANAIAKYKNKSVQAHAAINVRASRNTLIANTIVDGANRGVVGTNVNGDILYGLFASSIVYAEKYSDGISAYAHSFGDGAGGGKPIGCLAAGLSLRAKPRDSVTPTLCFAKEIVGQYESFTSSITNVPPGSNPIVIRAGANSILIQGILDFIDGGAPSSEGFILFDGPCSNISVLGCKTPRTNMFKLLSNVTDLTVDFPRTATVVGTTGSFVKTDPNDLISTITPSATQLTIEFNAHVTAAALQGIVARSTLHFTPPAIICVAGVSGKTVTLRFFDYAGVLINPSTTSASATLIINS